MERLIQPHISQDIKWSTIRRATMLMYKKRGGKLVHKCINKTLNSKPISVYKTPVGAASNK